MTYIVFARKYRPRSFDEIVGQAHITTTLTNAISQNRVAHAYLFAGPRGVGKTTTARILAKALNCDEGPTAKPCNACNACKEIAQGTSLDILEIDGASNRGIEEIRNLRESVKFSPSRGRYKVYIIDEVHMLTPEAFNALLKTLEEPPRHVKFIFATTRIYKVPLTILSRCQRFDFRKISIKDILDNIKGIAKAEGLDVNDDVLGLVAKAADGSLRDAQVVLDQIISFAQGKSIGLDDVNSLLGIIDDEILFGLSKAIGEHDAVSALRIIDRFIKEGKEAIQVVFGLIEHFRNMSMIKINKDLSALIDAGPDRISRYASEASRFTTEDILYIIYTLSNTIDFIRKSNIPRIPLETAVIKLARSGSILSLAEIMERLERLEKKSEVGSRKLEVESQKSEFVNCGPSPIEHEQKNALPETKQAEITPDPPAPAASADMDELLSSWGSVINYVKARKISIASYLEEGYPVAIEPNTVKIGLPKEMQLHKEMLELPENRRLVEEAFKNALKLDRRVSFVSVEPVAMPSRRPAERPEGGFTAGDTAEDEPAKKEVDPIVKSALEMFSGEISQEEARRRRVR